MKKFFSNNKIIFYIFNFFLILLYLYPGSLLGLLIYSNEKIQPQITADFLISSNHFYVFVILTILGFLTFPKFNQSKSLIIYLVSLSIILEIFHIAIPERSFQWSDLFGNVIGGLKNMIGNFLKELVGKFLNAPLCAAEQFLGTLLGDIMGSINSVIGPILSSLTAVLGGALGSVNGLINKALAGVGLLYNFIACNEFKCPLPSRFDNKLGPKQNDVDRIDKITKTMSSLSDGLGGTNLPSVF